MEAHYRRVLSIAGSDSGGGAGIQADLKAISACGCYGMTAITAITVQNTMGVKDVFPVPVNIVLEQIAAVMDDIGADAIKIGMLHSSEIIKGISEVLDQYKIRNIVLDPVMVSTSGHQLLQDEAIESLKNELFLKARVITPNIPEAEILSGKTIQSQHEMPGIARELSFGGRVSVLLKAGHLTDRDLIDVFYNAETDQILELKSIRIDTKNTHGTGCTLSSAVASFLARGFSLDDAVRSAKNYINEAIIEGSKYTLGKGNGPVHHFYNFWK